MKATAKNPPGWRYISRTPRKIPAGRVVVHNHVRPRRDMSDVPLGFNGFRAWTQLLEVCDYDLEVCDCGWASELGMHYRVAWQTEAHWPTRPKRRGADASRAET